MNNENTIYDNEKTQYDQQPAAGENIEAQGSTPQEASAETDQEAKSEPDADKEKRGGSWGIAATGVGTGMLLGSIASFFATKEAIASTAEEETADSGDQPTEHPAWTDGEVAIATTVSDDMSFSQAFAAARAEVGPGGAFEWHGNVYGTYLADEWNSMSPAEQEAYNNHFVWSQHHTTTTAQHTQQPDTRPDIEEIRVDAAGDTEVASHGSHGSNAGSYANDDVIGVVDDNETPEVVVLGVAEHEESGAVIGGMLIDGEEVYLIDIDHDGTFDVLASDANHDGTFDADEVADISDQQITVNDLQNLASHNDAMYASNDIEPDYVNDANSDAYVS